MIGKKSPTCNACGMCKIGLLVSLIILVLAALLLSNTSTQQSTNQKNKEIAVQLLHQGIETGDIAVLADAYFDPNITLEYPPDFHLPPDHKSSVTGIENVKNAGKAWKADTMHQVDIVDAISENNIVAIRLNQDRVFKTNTGIVRYEDHPAMYFIYFKNGKIVRIVGVFDVLDAVEAAKDSKYCSFTGEWETNWGNMTIYQSDNVVTSTYDYFYPYYNETGIGRINGTLVGKTLKGTWKNTPIKTEPYDGGGFEFYMSADCNSFTGVWGYGSDLNGTDGWNGTRIR